MPPHGNPSYGAMYPPGHMYGHHGYPPYGMPYGGAPGANTGPDPTPVTPGKEGKGAAQAGMDKGRKRERGGSKKVESAAQAGTAAELGAQAAPEEDGPSPSEDGGEDGSTEDMGAGDSSDVAGRRAPVGGVPFSPDYWQPGRAPGQQGMGHGGASNGQLAIVPAPSIGVPSELWCQDDRELKKQRRKQSNRESARRSRLRKQAENEELSTKMEKLVEENVGLKAELAKVKAECSRLEAGNAALQEQLGSIHGGVLQQTQAAAAPSPPVAAHAAACAPQPPQQLPPKRPSPASEEPPPATSAAPDLGTTPALTLQPATLATGSDELAAAAAPPAAAARGAGQGKGAATVPAGPAELPAELPAVEMVKLLAAQEPPGPADGGGSGHAAAVAAAGAGAAPPGEPQGTQSPQVEQSRADTAKTDAAAKGGEWAAAAAAGPGEGFSSGDGGIEAEGALKEEGGPTMVR